MVGQIRTDGKVVISTKLDNSGLKKGLSGLKSALSGIGSAIGIAFGVGALISFGKEAINLASDLQEVQNVVDVAFGSMSDSVNEFAKNAMKQFGLSELVAKKYMGTFGAMSKSFGYSVKEAYQQAKTLTGLVGDVASFYNLSADEAYTKLKAVYTGETEALKDLGVVMTQTALDEFALANGFGKTTKSMSEQEKVALRLAFVQNSLNSAAGDFARTSDSWANQTKVLSLQFDSLKAAIGTGLIQVFTPVLKMLNQLLATLTRLAEKFKDVTATLFGKQVLPTESAAEGVDALAEAEEGLAESTDKATEAAKRSLAGFDKLNKLGDDESASASTSTAGGLSGSLGEVTWDTEDAEDSAENLGTALERLQKMIEPLKNISLDNLKDSLGGLWGELERLGGNIWDGLEWAYYNILVPLAQWTIEEAAPAAVDVFSGALEVFNSVLEALEPLGKWLWESFLQPLGEWTGEKIVDALKWLAEKLQDISDWINENQTTLETLAIIIGSVAAAILLYTTYQKLSTKAMLIFQTATNAVSAAFTLANIKTMLIVAAIAAVIAIIVLCVKHWDDIKAAAITAWEKIKETWQKVKAWFSKNVTEPIADFFSELWNGLKNSAQNAWTNIKNAFSSVGEFFGGIWEKIKTKFTDIGQKIGDAVGSAFKKAVNAVLSTIEKVANAPINAINSLLDVINTVPGINIGKLNTFTLPRLAQGAVIPANKEFLAVLGDQKNGRNLELPENLLRQIVREESGGGRHNGIPFIIQLVLNGKIIGEEAVEYVNGVIRKTGKSPIKQGG